MTGFVGVRGRAAGARAGPGVVKKRIKQVSKTMSPQLDTEMSMEYLLASAFDQTLSFNDSGHVLSEILGIPGYEEKVAGLSRSNLVQQGAELAYLLRHDPQFRGVTRSDLIEVGRRVRLKRNVGLLTRLLDEGIDGHKFDFYVISAAPEEVEIEF